MAVVEGITSRRSRRAILAGAFGALGAVIARSVGASDPVDAAGSVLLGATNIETTPTAIRNNASSASAIALSGRSVYAGATGLKGIAEGTNGVGVYGVANKGYGVRTAGITGVDAAGTTVGVTATASATNGTGVKGVADAGVDATGVWGKSTAGTGVHGEATGNNTTGVFGVADNGFGSIGVKGQSRDGIGVKGVATSPGFFTTYGVWAESGTYQGVGLMAEATYALDTTTYGIWSQTNSNFGTAVMGYASNGTGPNSGVRGECEGSDGTGVFGWGKKSTGVNYGVKGQTQSADGFAGHFTGHTHVQGTFTSTDKQFLIDHPQRPAAMTLAHACVEAPERLNVYRGAVTLDDNGSATVRLPRYFAALNADYSYQLTPIGPTSSVLYIAREINEAGSFRIGGGTAGQRVCWQVTGARKDAWALQHPFRVERRKRVREQGKYLDPALYGKPSSDALYPPAKPVKRPTLRSRERRQSRVAA